MERLDKLLKKNFLKLSFIPDIYYIYYKQKGDYMTELIKVEKRGVSAFELYEYLKVGTKFSMWIKRRFADYGFKEGEDFIPFLGQSNGGRPREDFILSLDTAKEIAMVEKTKEGREIRKYFIECEKKFRQNEALRSAGIMARKTLTDKIKESGENERQKGHAFSNYTKMIYQKLGIDYQKQKDFRDTLTPEQLKDISAMEITIGGLIELGLKYSEIKNTLPDCIKKIEKKLEVADNV